MLCFHNNDIAARGILVTMLHCGTPEPRLSAIYIVSSVGTSLLKIHQSKIFQTNKTNNKKQA